MYKPLKSALERDFKVLGLTVVSEMVMLGLEDEIIWGEVSGEQCLTKM